MADGSLVTCFLYDTNGQEQYDALSDIYYRDADGCLLVYDITNKESFDSIKNTYIPKIKEKCKQNMQIVLIGNKLDLDYDRKVTYDEGSKLALDNNFHFKETSCVDNINVNKVFQTIIEMSKFERKNEKDTIIKTQSIKIKKSKTDNGHKSTKEKIANYFIINWSYIYVVFNFIFNLAVNDLFIFKNKYNYILK